MTCIDPVSEGISSVSPSAMTTYLSETGWRPRRNTGTVTIYRRDLGQTWDEVSVPNGTAFSDYADIVRSAVRTVSKVESRPVTEVLADMLSGNTGGWIQYRLETQDRSGTVPADRVLQVIQAHQGMSVAVCNGDEEAVRNMRMGQTGYGGYLLRFAHLAPQGRNEIVRRLFETADALVGCVTEGSGSALPDGVSSEFVSSFMGLRSKRGLGMEISLTASNGHDEKLNVTDEMFGRIGDMFGQFALPSGSGSR